MMMILARPSVSPYLTRSLMESSVPVVLAEEFAIPMRPALRVVGRDEILRNPRLAYESLLLTSSENALNFLYEAIPHDDRVLKARIFKDKAVFRAAIRRLFPEFFYRELPLADLEKVDPASLKYPLVVKPAVGISSIGVARVGSAAEWPTAAAYLKGELEHYARNYADAVVEEGKVLLEEWIPGTELAIDGYFNSQREPVVLNILEHPFAGDGDTSDRIYFTHRGLIRKQLEAVTQFLRRFGDLFDLRRFPFHLEVRVTPDGRIVPIELNPLRFSGIGTTEIAEYAYGINVYKLFFEETAPDWDTILASPDTSIYSFMCADIPTDHFRKPGLRILDREFARQFGEILDYRMLSESETSTFAVIFYRSEDETENRRLLTEDFSKFMAYSR